MAKQPKKWIAGAIEHEGALTRKAQAKDMTVQQYCSQAKGKLTSTSQRQCNLARTLRRMNKG